MLIQIVERLCIKQWNPAGAFPAGDRVFSGQGSAGGTKQFSETGSGFDYSGY